MYNAMRSRQRVKAMATISVNTAQYNEDEVGVSVWAGPICEGGGAGWCGAHLYLRVGVSSCTGGGVVVPAEGGERKEVVTPAHSTDNTCTKHSWN